MSASETDDVSSARGVSSAEDDSSAVICWGKRTAFCKSGQGSFRGLSVCELLVPLLKAARDENPTLPLDELGDVVIGSGLAAGSFGTTEIRMATQLAGYPLRVPSRTVNRHCGSGLQSLVDAAAQVQAGNYEAALAGGAESMSAHWRTNNEHMASERAAHQQRGAAPLLDAYFLSMGETSEELASRYSVGRAEQDAWALQSHQRALAAAQSGRLQREIVAVDVGGALVDGDEGIRADTSLERLAALRTPFRPTGGSTTAGNASQVSDGAALLLVASRRFCRAHALPALGRIVASATVGVDPAVMGVGPAAAIPAALAKARLSVADVDLFEINEAFASQCRYCVDALGLDPAKVNVNGGAIALGHPLGATGARLVIALLLELRLRRLRYGVVSLCIGSGMGIAAVLECLFEN